MGLERDSLLVITAASIVGLVVLIAHFKVQSFIALLLASLTVGICAGGTPLDVARSFAEGVGSVLGSIALVIAFGAILGKTLSASGGAERIANALIRAWGPRRASWAIALGAFLIGLPVFFGVGLVLLAPIVFVAAKQARTPPLRLGLPLVAGLSVAHGLVPPHPGPIAAVELLKANIGKTILLSLAVGLPTVLVCGPLLGAFLVRGQRSESGDEPVRQAEPAEHRTVPSTSLALFTLLLPVLLMLLSTVAELTLSPRGSFRDWIEWLGDPTIAMLVAVLFSFWSFGTRCGFDRHQLGRFSEECLAPVAAILLVVGAGGGFSRVLIDTGIGNAIARLATDSGISALFLGWLVAALVRIATGSATVSITTASGLLAPIAATRPDLNRELLVLAMGGGSLILSHVNDGGFWMVKEYLNLDVPQTLKTWSIIETMISVTILVLVLLLSLIV